MVTNHQIRCDPGPSPERYRCIGKFFGDIVEKLVFDLFEDMRAGDDW